MLKQASFAICRLNITQMMFKQIQSSIAQNNFPTFRVQIYQLDEYNKQVKFLFDKPYKLLSARAMERFEMTKNSAHAQFVLSNPILHFMGTTNTYNKVLENETSYNAIIDFEKFLKESYGNCFYKNHVCVTDKKNDYKYEQMLMRSSNDLNIPSHIISCYKPFHSFNYYFFDDFNISAESDKDITLHHINMYDKKKFKRFDISPYADINIGTRYIGKSDFSDVYNNINKTNPSIHIAGREKDNNTTKSQKDNIPQMITSSSEDEEYESNLSDRETSYTKNQQQNQAINQSLFYRNIYTPDNTDNAKERISTLTDLINNKIALIELYETKDCLADWLQFGKIYNLEKDNKSSYTYTPINIINTFTRVAEKEYPLKHSCLYSMMKFFDDK